MEPRPSGDEAKRFSQRTRQMGEHGFLTPEEAAELLEAAAGRLTDWGSAAEAIAALEARRQRLNTEKEQLLDIMAEHPSATDAIGHLRKVHEDLRRTLELLAHYRAQRDQAN